MKKIYAILVAAVMSVSLFAAPTQADLQSYMEEGYYVVCFQAPEGSTCNDIYWMGQYADWNISTALEDLVICEPLTGANAGWYVAKVPADKGTNGKPIQLNECGKLTWDVQPGSHDKITLVAGSVNIIDKGAETDLEGFSTTEPTILTIAGWKNDYNPCEMVCEQQVYTIRIYPPYCEYLEDLAPTIMGSFNNWSGAITMEFKGSYFEYVTEPVTAGFEFKFNNDPNGTWTHEFQHYDAENDSWTNVPASGNFSLTNGTEFYVREGNVLTFDFSDDSKFQYAGCEEQEEIEEKEFDYNITVANAPVCGEAVLSIVGGFEACGWTVANAVAVENGAAALHAKNTDEFKFLDKSKGLDEDPDNDWSNEVIGFAQTTFHKADMADGAEDGAIAIDLAETYFAACAPEEGIENVVLTEKAHKVVVDGVLYIVRDNKMYNAQGTQVR